MSRGGPKRATDPSEMSNEVMHCRAFGHQWQDHGATKVGRGMAEGWRVTQVCTCCGTLKLFTLSRKGDMAEVRYIYPDYYLARFFVGNEERRAFRLESLADTLARSTPRKVSA